MAKYSPKTKIRLKELVEDNSVYLGDIDTSNIIDMKMLFYNSKRADFSGIEKWDTSKVKTMNNMFYGSQFNHNINDWDVSNVENMGSMFDSTPFNQPLNKWNVSNVEDMESMFSATPFNQPLDKWNVSKVANMNYMFGDSSFNQPLDNWDTSNVEDMEGMFNGICDKVKLPTWYLKQFENNNDELVDMWAFDASAICEQLKVAYIVGVDNDNCISEVIEQYPSRLEATWALKEKYDNGDLDDDKDYYAVIGYEPNEITPKSLEPLIDMQVEDADWLLRKCIHRAIAFDNTSGTYDCGSVGKIYGVYATRLEVIDKLENNRPKEWGEEGDVQSLGYQPKFDIQTFVGREFWFSVEALRWVEWARFCYWWMEVIEDDGQIVRIVKEFGDFNEAEEYGQDLPPAESGRYYALGDNAGMRITSYGGGDED